MLATERCVIRTFGRYTSRQKQLEFVLVVLALGGSACDKQEASAHASQPVTAPGVGVTEVSARPLSQELTVSSELVPFQEIDVYAKESGYVKKLLVDYGSRVAAGQLLAVLEIPELEAQIQQRQAAISAQVQEVARAQDEVGRAKAQHDMVHLQYERLSGVAKSKPGMVAQQEVDDVQGKDLAAESNLQAVKGAYQAAIGQLAVAKAQLTHDQDLFSYSRITAPFSGVVTQRYANLGALMQAGTSSNQSTPLVRLSDESLYRLVIPVPESYVRYVHIGDKIEVRVPSLGKSFPGKVVRFSVDVSSATRTMHTEVDVPNPNRVLIPGLYAEAVLTLSERAHAIAVPLQAVEQNGSDVAVYVVSPDDHVDRRPVKLGVKTANYAEIVSGVALGEQVVVSDRSGLKPGEAVKPHPVAAMVYDQKSQQDQDQ